MVHLLIINRAGMDYHHRTVFANIKTAGKHALDPNGGIILVKSSIMDHFTQSIEYFLRLLRRCTLAIVANKHFVYHRRWGRRKSQNLSCFDIISAREGGKQMGNVSPFFISLSILCRIAN